MQKLIQIEQMGSPVLLEKIIYFNVKHIYSFWDIILYKYNIGECISMCMTDNK